MNLHSANSLSIRLNFGLKVPLGVLAWSKKNDVGSWDEEADDNGVRTRQLGHCVEKLHILPPEHNVGREISAPAQVKQNQAKCDGLCFIVVFREIFSHVREAETDNAEKPEEKPSKDGHAQ